MIRWLPYNVAKRHVEYVRRGLTAELIRAQINLTAVSAESDIEFARQLEVRLVILKEREDVLNKEPRGRPRFWERLVFRLYVWATKERFSKCDVNERD